MGLPKALGSALNAPITIWFLSAITLGLFGTIYDEMRRCRAVADQAVADYHRLGTEIRNRRLALYAAIREAKSIDDLRTSRIVANWRLEYTFLQYKGRTIKDLEEQQLRLAVLLSEELRLLGRINSMTSASLRRKLLGELVRGFDFDRPDFSKITNENLPSIKKAADEQTRIMLRHMEISLRVPITQCGVASSVRRVLFGRPRHVAKFETPEFIKKRPGKTVAMPEQRTKRPGSNAATVPKKGSSPTKD